VNNKCKDVLMLLLKLGNKWKLLPDLLCGYLYLWANIWLIYLSSNSYESKIAVILAYQVAIILIFPLCNYSKLYNINIM
jgi:hypothetical protein